MPILELRVVESDTGPYTVRFGNLEGHGPDLDQALSMLRHRIDRAGESWARSVLRDGARAETVTPRGRGT